MEQNCKIYTYQNKVLQFNQSNTAAVLILTLTEKVSIINPYYLFVFTHVLTRQKVKFIKGVDDEESEYTNRYNQFTIDATAVFEDAPIGQWNFTVYEQESDTNTDEEDAGAIIEYGKLILDRATAFEFTKYNESTSFKAYNG